MSSGLDKLKALASRLEDKIEQKNKPLVPPVKEVLKPVAEKPILKPIKKDTPKVIHKPVHTSVQKSVVKPIKDSKKSFDTVRSTNTQRVKQLYEKLKIFEKCTDFTNIFVYKAMNLSGIGLKEDDFGHVREGKYIQIIAITYEPDKNGKKKAKNISLGYFGKAETLDPDLKNEIIEFVLRWRYEKAFQNLGHYKDLIAKVDTPSST